MEEQNQEKETTTQHVTVSDAAAPETGTENKGKKSGEKDRKPAKELTPKQMQQRKKLLVYPLMGLLFLGSMWLIFAPSDKKDESGETVGAFNADIPLPENDGIIGDKRKAYEGWKRSRRTRYVRWRTSPFRAITMRTGWNWNCRTVNRNGSRSRIIREAHGQAA